MGFDFLENKQSLLTRGVLLLLALTFVIGFGYVGGIDLGGQGTASGTAVEVNGEKVSYAQFKNLKDSIRRQYAQNQGELPPQLIDFINYTALNNLVELKLFSQKARELGLRISDSELAESITSNPAFQVDGVFVGKENYESFIRQRLNQTVGSFERSYKDELLARKLINIINDSAKVTDEELFNLYKVQNEEIKLNYVSFEADDFVDAIKPSDQEINKYYIDNKENFKTEEKRKIEYITFSESDFESNINISEDELKAYYNAYLDEFDVEGTITPYEKAKPQIESKLKTPRVNKAYNDFVAGFSENNIESLDNISSQYSFGTVKQSDYFSRDESKTLSNAVTNKAFLIDKGEISVVSDNSNSWIIKVVEIQPSMEKEISEVKNEIITILKNEKAKNAARVSADETLKKLQDSGKGFIERTRNLGIEVSETGFFNRLNGPSEINSKEIILESFQLDPDNPVLPKVYSSDEKFIIASLKERKEIQPQDFEENKFSVKEREVSRLRREIVENWLEDIRSQAKIVPNKSLFPAQS